MRENVLFSIIFGDFTVHRPPLLVHHESLSKLADIVEVLMPVDASVGIVCDDGIPLVKLHKDEVSRFVSYYGSHSDLSNFKETYNIIDFFSTRINSDLSVSMLGVNSSTPVKSSN